MPPGIEFNGSEIARLTGRSITSLNRLFRQRIFEQAGATVITLPDADWRPGMVKYRVRGLSAEMIKTVVDTNMRVYRAKTIEAPSQVVGTVMPQVQTIMAQKMRPTVKTIPGADLSVSPLSAKLASKLDRFQIACVLDDRKWALVLKLAALDDGDLSVVEALLA